MSDEQIKQAEFKNMFMSGISTKVVATAIWGGASDQGANDAAALARLKERIEKLTGEQKDVFLTWHCAMHLVENVIKELERAMRDFEKACMTLVKNLAEDVEIKALLDKHVDLATTSFTSTLGFLVYRLIGEHNGTENLSKEFKAFMAEKHPEVDVARDLSFSSERGSRYDARLRNILATYVVVQTGLLEEFFEWLREDKRESKLATKVKEFVIDAPANRLLLQAYSIAILRIVYPLDLARVSSNV